MGVGESLKEIYYSGEEKWYNTLDKIDEHLPVYKVIDPIDDIFPSFALFLILIFIIILALILGAVGFVGAGSSTLQLSVVDGAGNSVSGAQVEVEGINDTFYSDDFGLVPPITVPYGVTLSVSARKNTENTTVPVVITSSVVNEEIKLSGLNVRFSESKVIQLITETGARADGSITLTYSCSSGVEAPLSQTTYDGTANVESPSDCGVLTVTVTSDKYNTRTAVLDKPSNTISLETAIVRQPSRAVVTLTSSDTNDLDGITVYAYSVDNFIGEQETAVSLNGQAVFEIPEGDYRFETKMEKGFKPAQSAIVTLSPTTTKQVSITLQKNFLGYINVITKEGSSKLSDVRVTLMKGTSEVRALNTDSNGAVSFELTDNSTFRILAYKENYCIASKDANVGDSVTLQMVKNTGQCGGTLKAQVMDQDNKPVAYARVIIFGEKDEDAYKLGYIEKLTDYNGMVSWNPVSYSGTNETYKVFAYKGTYSGWSIASEFTPQNESSIYKVSLEIPLGTVSVTVKDNDGNPLQFSEVQLFGDYDSAKLTGKKIVEGADGKIDFSVKAGRRVYAVVKKDGYESYTTLPKQIIGAGTISYTVVLSKPPVEQLRVNYLGLYKDDALALRAEPGKEYTALFEVIAPKNYEELGFFVRVGKDNVTKTELDKLYIKELIAPGVNTITTGASYNQYKGYSTDEQYLNLEQSKWAETNWQSGNYQVGKIIVGAKVKIKDTAQPNEQLVIAYRAWGVDGGSYERDVTDDVLGTAQSNSVKQELYAATKEAYAWVGTEALCENTDNPTNTFCITATYTDPDGFTNSFDSGFDAKNNTPYNVSIKLMSASSITFDKAAIKIENPEENLYLGDYSIITPTNAIKNGSINGYESSWIDTPNFSPNTSISISSLELTPNKVGSGILRIRTRDNSNLIFEKDFTINIASDKKMKAQYMYNNKFQDEMPQIVSGKPEILTVKALNTSNNLEIEGALVKLYDRFGTLLTTSTTNSIGIATINIPASLPGEKLVLKIEKSEYETLVKEFTISEDIVDVTPTELSFTINPQTTTEDSKTVKIENKTGFDLTIKSITLTGKFKGLISESQVESWFNTMKGTVIKSNDYLETEFKVFVGKVVTQSDDLTGTFEIVVGNDYYSWQQDIPAKIRVGLGADVDDPNCLEITKSDWKTSTQGKEVEVAFDVVNNCMASAQLVGLKNLGARNENTGNNLGTMSVQSNPGYAELSRSYDRVFRSDIGPGETVPITLKFVPYGGVNGNASGKIIFSAKNLTDSKDQVISAEMTYSIDVVNISECLVVGSDLVKIAPNETGTFSVTNTCPVKADMEVESELQLSDKLFTLNANESKDITITRNEGDVAGAYNILVKGRQGNDKQQLIGNVKAILDSDGCITLSRYEYDVYDNPANEFDGTDTGYLRNNCTQKNIGVQVEGVEPYDKERVWKEALLGAVIGFMKSDCKGIIAPLLGQGISSAIGLNCQTGEWVDKSESNLSKAKEDAFIKLKNQTRKEAQTLAALIAAQQGLVDGNRMLALEELNKQIDDLNTQAKATYQSDQDICNFSCANVAELQACLTQAKTNYENKQVDLFNLQKDKNDKINKLYDQISQETKAAAQDLGKATDKATQANDKAKNDIETLIQQARVGNADELETKLKEQEVDNEAKLATAIRDHNDKINASYDAWNAMVKDKSYKLTDAEVKAQSIKVTSELDTSKICTTPKPTKPQEQKPQTAPKHVTYKGYKIEQAANGWTIYDTDGTTQLSTAKDEKAATDYIDNIKPVKKTESATTIPETQKPDIVPETITLGLTKQSLEECKNSPDSTSYKEYTITKKTDSDGCTYLFSGPSGNGTATTIDDAKKIIDAAIEKTTAPANQNTTVNKTENTTEPTINRQIYPETVEGDITTKFPVGAKVIKSSDGTTATVAYNGQITTYVKNFSPIDKGTEQWLWQRTEGTPTGQFLLASSPSTAPRTDPFSQLTNVFTGNIPGVIGGGFSNSAIGGAVVSALLEMMMAQDTPIQYSDTFAVNKVQIGDISLESPEGIGISVGDVTYDFDNTSESFSNVGETSSGGSHSQIQPSGTTAGWNPASQANGTSGYQGLTNRTQLNSGVMFNPQALSATQGLVQIRELTFSNPSQATNNTPYEPFAGILTVSATENVYQTDYNYDGVKKSAKARGDYKEAKPIFDIPIIGDLFKPQQTTVAAIDENDLVVSSVRDYTKKFHLLFNSYEYFDCGPNTYPCPAQLIGNCTVGTKTGSTGLEAAPKLLLAWNWTDVSLDTCDEDNADYVYCDTTQLTISTLEQLQQMKNFFKTTSLSKCPQAIDVAGTKSQELKSNALDVGITLITMKTTTDGVNIQTIVQTNNNQSMSGKVSFKVERDGTDYAPVECKNIDKTFTSEQRYDCNILTSDLGSGGTFNVTATLTPTLCSTGCENNDTSNDSITSTLVVGSGTVQACQDYSTSYDYFQKVLTANLGTVSGNAKTVLHNTNYTVNLVRDGFSSDFKNDFDAYSLTLANAPSYYKNEGLRELFLSDKFKVDWPSSPGAWEAGKYNARLIVEFENGWTWDNNNSNIKSVTLKLEPWGLPEPNHSIYNVGFDGTVGIETDNGRQGYGTNFTQTSETPLYINSNLQARPDPRNNALSNAIVNVDKSFYTMNTSRKGDILSVNRSGDNVSISLAPSIAVPVVLNITRNTARDAYAYYMVEVDGRPENDLGSSFLIWNGIGQGCYDFQGAGMTNWSNASDSKSDAADQGYGLRWNNATHAGTVSLYSTFYVPQESASLFRITSQSESASIESPFGNGQNISISASGGVKSLQDVIDKVKSGDVCVVGGEYFWNSGTVYAPLQSSIDGKENTCIAQ